MTNEKYFEIDAINQSFLKTYMICPYWAQMEREHAYERSSTKAMETGTALDCLVTEGINSFNAKYSVVKRRSGNSNGKIEITQGEYDKIYNMMVAVENNPVYARFIKNAEGQKVITGELYGVKVKAKLDYYDKGMVADLKQCRDAAWRMFRYTVEDYDYLFQLAFYRVMAKIESGVPKTKIKCYIVASDPSPKAIVYKFSQRLLARKERTIMHLLKNKPWEKRVDKCECNAIGKCPFAVQREIINITEKDV